MATMASTNTCRRLPRRYLDPCELASRPLAKAKLWIPLDTSSLPPTTTTTLNPDHSNHKALLATIPQIGDLSPHITSTPTFPTTRDHPPFILPIPTTTRRSISTTRKSQQEAIMTLQQLHNSNQVTTDHIDKVAHLVVDAINDYHLLAQKIWPMVQSSTTETNTKLHSLIPKLVTR